MWPRGDATLGPGNDMTSTRRSKNVGLSGFVAYMKRKDAEAALRELDGFDWGGSILRVGWSKAVPVAAKAMYGKSPLCIHSMVGGTDGKLQWSKRAGRKREVGAGVASGAGLREGMAGVGVAALLVILVLQSVSAPTAARLLVPVLGLGLDLQHDPRGDVHTAVAINVTAARGQDRLRGRGQRSHREGMGRESRRVMKKTFLRCLSELSLRRLRGTVRNMPRACRRESM